MNRRTFLTTLPVITVASVFAGCAAWLGLADRVEVTRKFIEVSETDGSTHLLADVRYDDADGQFYEREPHDVLVDGDRDGGGNGDADGNGTDPDEALTISEAASNRLQNEFAAVRYGIRGCERSSGETSIGDCRETVLFLDDFNDVDVGDVVDVRFGDETSGIVDVHERRDE